MLFSEPKIPQSSKTSFSREIPTCFSALQRAENSSILISNLTRFSFARFSALQRAENSSINPTAGGCVDPPLFQCSSASRKFLNCSTHRRADDVCSRFSALQRAENSSIMYEDVWCTLNRSFSALQRAENSSIANKCDFPHRRPAVSVLFSEPKIPQSARTAIARRRWGAVSVLFSEPKIPQFIWKQ